MKNIIKKIDKSLLLIFILLIIIYLLNNINKNISISGFSVGGQPSVEGVCAVPGYNPTGENKIICCRAGFTKFCDDPEPEPTRTPSTANSPNPPAPGGTG